MSRVDLPFANRLMQLLVNSRYPVARKTEEDFIVPILIDIRGSGEDALFDAYLDRFPDDEDAPESLAMEGTSLDEGIDNFLIGRVRLERLLVSDAEYAGYGLMFLCDALSARWLEVAETLTRKGGQRMRRDLNLDGFVDDILYLHEIVLHPEIEDRVPLVDAAIRAASGLNSLVVASYRDEGERPLRDAEYREVGFRKIASSDLLLRDNRLRYPFGDKYPSGRSVEFRATREHEAWMLGKWQSLNLDSEV